MPKIFEQDGFIFFFYSNENNEPCHTHVRKGDGYGKIWLEPNIVPAYFEDFSSKDIRKIMDIVEVNNLLMKTKWNEYFNSK